MNSTQQKIALIQKILNARLTDAETKEVIKKAEELLHNRNK